MIVIFKLFICDILELKEVPDDNCYVFNDSKIKHVEIVGLIKYKKELQNKITIYQVDDGTGVIECILRGEENAIPQHCEDMSKICQRLLRKVKEAVTARTDSQIGSHVKINGSIAEYRGKREILIKRLTPIMDKNEELIHLYVKLALYGDVYGAQQQ